MLEHVRHHEPWATDRTEAGKDGRILLVGRPWDLPGRTGANEGAIIVDLGRARLPGHRVLAEREALEFRVRSALRVGRHTLEPLEHHATGITRYGHVVFDLGEKSLEYFPVFLVSAPGPFHGQRDLGHIEGPAIGKGRVGVRQL